MGGDSHLALHEQMKALFDWNPSTLEPFFLRQECPDVEHDYYGLPRVSGFYDKHMSDNLVLKHIVHVPGLHKMIAEEASRALDARMQAGLPDASEELDGNFPDRLDRCCNHLVSMFWVTELQKHHCDGFHPFCGLVASTLAFGTPWENILKLEQRLSTRRIASYGTSIQLNHLAKPPSKTKLDQLGVEPDKQPLVCAMHSVFPDIATYEFINATNGSMDVMFAMQLMAIGHDEHPKFKWEGRSETQSTRSTSKRSRDEDDRDFVDCPETYAWIQRSSAKHHLRRSDRLAKRSGISNDRKRRRLLDDALGRSGSSLKRIKAMDKKYWKAAEGLEYSNSKDKWTSFHRDEESLTETALRRSANKLFQQAWAQGVRQGSTFLVINSGNYEFIGIRHRESQTLYVSDVLPVSKLVRPGYGQVHVGLYLMALTDAIRRTKVLETKDKPSSNPTGDAQPSEDNQASPWPVSPHRLFRDWFHNYVTELRGDAILPEVTDMRALVPEIVDRKVLLVSLYHDIYDSDAPIQFSRALSIDDSQTLSSQSDDAVHIILGPHIGIGSTGVSHGGCLMTGAERAVLPHPVAVKLAFTEDQRERLYREAQIYERLANRNVAGIPTYFGFFRSRAEDGQQEGPSCLVLSYEGTPLSDIDRKPLTGAQRDQLLSTLKSIHQAGVIHGDIEREQNIVVSDDGRAAIIDFSHSERRVVPDTFSAEQGEAYNMHSKQAIDEEYKDLDRILRDHVNNDAEYFKRLAARRRARD